MTLRKVFLSLLHLFTVFSFLSAACFFAALSFFPHLRKQAIDFLLVDFEKCRLISGALLASALILWASFYFLERGRFLVIRMGVGVNLRLVKKAIDECFRKEMEKKISLLELEVGAGDLLEMKVRLSSEKEMDEVLQKAEHTLSLLLQSRFGYRKSFDLVVKE